MNRAKLLRSGGRYFRWVRISHHGSIETLGMVWRGRNPHKIVIMRTFPLVSVGCRDQNQVNVKHMDTHNFPQGHCASGLVSIWLQLPVTGTQQNSTNWGVKSCWDMDGVYQRHHKVSLTFITTAGHNTFSRLVSL